MIVVELIKYDPYLNREKTKTWDCYTEEKARSVVSAQSSVLRIASNQITEEKDHDGKLIKIVMRPGEQAPVQPSLPTPAASPLTITGDAAAENEECARLTEQILGENNNLALLIRHRMRAQVKL